MKSITRHVAAAGLAAALLLSPAAGAALPAADTRPSPATLSMVVGQATAVISELAGGTTPPGVSPLSPVPGEILVTDPWAGSTREVMDTHPRCPVCFGRDQRKASMTASSCAP